MKGRGSSTYNGWGKFDVEAFWNWVAQGYPQRWAFWRFRDELDGGLCGVAAGLLVVAVAAVLSVLL